MKERVREPRGGSSATPANRPRQGIYAAVQAARWPYFVSSDLARRTGFVRVQWWPLSGLLPGGLFLTPNKGKVPRAGGHLTEATQ